MAGTLKLDTRGLHLLRQPVDERLLLSQFVQVQRERVRPEVVRLQRAANHVAVRLRLLSSAVGILRLRLCVALLLHLKVEHKCHRLEPPLRAF